MTVKVSTHAPVVSNRDRVVLFTRRKIASTHDFVPFVFLGYSFHTWEHVHAVLSDKKLVVAKGCAFVNKLASTSLRFRSVIIIIIIIIITIIIIIIIITIIIVVVVVIVIVIVIYLSTYLFLFYYCILV